MNENADLIASVAHRIRTPLTVIASTVSNFLDGVYGRLNADQMMWMKKLESHLVRLEALLDQVLGVIRNSPEKAESIRQVIQDQVVSSLMPGTSHHVPQGRSGNAPLILVADDEPDVQDVISQGLEMDGLRVKTASNAEEAMLAVRTECPDVILMDLFLGDQNGLDVAQAVKSQISSDIPIVIITGQDDLRDKMADFKGKADDLLAKPFQMTELRIRVSAMLRLKSYMERGHQ